MNKSMTNIKDYFEGFKRRLYKFHPVIVGTAFILPFITVTATLTLIMTYAPVLIFAASVILIVWTIGSMVRKTKKEEETLKRLRELNEGKRRATLK